MAEEVKDVRSTDQQIREWVQIIIDLLLEGRPNSYIYKEMQNLTQKSISQVQMYVQKANNQLKEDHNQETAIKRAVHVEGLRKDLTEAYAQYLKTNKMNWFKIYLEIKKELKTFQPDDLRPGTEIETQAINITFSKVDDE